jgi:predicted nucleic acid-binding protein
VIYVDSSVALARLLAEPRHSPPAFWRENLVSSRLLEYQVWNRIHARQLADALAGQVQQLIDLIELLELSPPVLARALRSFPTPLRTLDALHVASMEYLRERGHDVTLASFDFRLQAAARALGVPLYDF